MADRVVLKDGTVLEGTAIRQGEGYWFKGADGQTRHIDGADVARIEKGSSADSGASMPAHSGAGLVSARSHAEACDRAVDAVAIWQQYLDSSPTGDDLKTAQAELARWQKQADDGAERINGRWVMGAERKAILEKAGALHKEGIELLKANQTLAAIKKLEEAQAVYPNSFYQTFDLGYLYLLQKDEIKAQTYLEHALRLRPKSPEAMGNLALCLYHKKQFIDSAMMAYKAAESGDTPEIAQNLVTLLARLSPSQRTSDRLKPAMDAANILAAKYNVSGPGPLFLVPLRLAPVHGTNTAGIAWSGSGFLIRADGLILTNRHVADGAKSISVVIGDQKPIPATVVNIDTAQDLALIQVKSASPLPFVVLAPTDIPANGAECTVMGFPLIDRLGQTIKITRGIVSSTMKDSGGADVMIDAKVNPGNSGGPILDKNGNVMAIVSMKSRSSSIEDSYGIGISAGVIRDYLNRNHIDLAKQPAAGNAMSTEQVAAKVTPATVCILATK